MEEQKYYTILTKIGKASIANAAALGTKINLVKLQLGDGAGKEYNPTEEQTELKKVVWECSISNVKVDKDNPNWIVIETIVPGSIGGFMIREVGIFDSENNMIAISKYPETYKPAVNSGSIKDLIIRIILAVSNTSSVELKVDPSVILATLKDIQNLDDKVEEIEEDLSTKIDEENNKQNIKIDQLTAGGFNVAYTYRTKLDDWTETENGNYKATITHNLLTQRIVVNLIDALTKENIAQNYKIIDDNNIEIRNESKSEIDVYVINGNAETHFINATVDDDIVGKNTTWSSEKIQNSIKEEVGKVEELLNGEITKGIDTFNKLVDML
ncbi:TPA: phage tail protein [Clostridioides difficile]|nr:phage tail protein [Clostridioides difficile]HBF5147656.1 phage tail protein [Clostridioides difficile]HBF5457488.1 phage tail protein [Clostridioides difficile]HBF6468876.1 phage tail protein [Clostridioides difficile]HBH3651425.1 phage tail protein [Clostridioides difficile]